MEDTENPKVPFQRTVSFSIADEKSGLVSITSSPAPSISRLSWSKNVSERGFIFFIACMALSKNSKDASTSWLFGIFFKICTKTRAATERQNAVNGFICRLLVNIEVSYMAWFAYGIDIKVTGKPHSCGDFSCCEQAAVLALLDYRVWKIIVSCLKYGGLMQTDRWCV